MLLQNEYGKTMKFGHLISATTKRPYYSQNENHWEEKIPHQSRAERIAYSRQKSDWTPSFHQNLLALLLEFYEISGSNLIHKQHFGFPYSHLILARPHSNSPPKPWKLAEEMPSIIILEFCLKPNPKQHNKLYPKVFLFGAHIGCAF